MPNPGRYPEYANSTGNDQNIIDFFAKERDMDSFLTNVCRILDQSVINYKNRNFTDLMIAFGCTGGQHRSVYCANRVSEYLKDKHHINVDLRHREQEMQR